MEVEKRGVRGGFFQLFDWNGKSRKKLFSSKSELPEISNQGKENYHGSVVSRRQQRSERFHYASSTSGDSECGTKAPGVVARLMGLDSLPTSNVNEPYFAPFVESLSFRDSGYSMARPALQSEHDIVIFESVRNKLDGSIRNPLDLRLQKVQSRPIERFQREVLPPKSAKPISITHHRLLSPIKSPGFVPPKNAAYIIEAAAKMIEQSPRSTMKGNSPSLGSSPVPFRIRDMKEKMEAAKRSSRSVDASQRGKEQSSVKNIKKQLNARGLGRSEDNYDETKRVGSQRLRSKDKSVSLAAQAKASTQKRDGLTSVGNRSSEKHKEHNDIKPNGPGRNLTNIQKKVEKQSSSKKPSEVLRLNNQKQNSASAKDRENSEPSCSHPKERKESNLSTNYIQGRTSRTVNNIVVNKVVTSRKTNFVAADPEKEHSSLRAKTTSKKKLPINGDSKWDEIDNKNSLDVVSFTFTSPIKKSGAGFSSCCTILEATNSSLPNCNPCVRESDSRYSAASSSVFNVIGGDALSVLLEQKLKELTSRVELSQKDLSEPSSISGSTNNNINIGSTVNLVNSIPMENDTCKSKQEIHASDCPSTGKLWHKAEREYKGLECVDSTEYQRYLHLQGCNSVSSQPSLSATSSDSFDVDGSSSNEGRLPCLSIESSEGMNWSSSRKFHPAEGEEISDTASSLSIRTMSETVASSLYMTDSKDNSHWELKYIVDILHSRGLLLEEFALGQAHKIIAPDLFDQLESQKMDSYKVMGEHVVLERKVLFDCVSECLEVRCGRLLAGSCKFWAKQTTTLHRRQWLAEDLYREISSWTNAEELMVDELVDKDMSSKSGKWIDFEVEGFEEGVEIEERILTSLVDELIDDFLLY
ncbi:UNVERIFIED_CONTAM: hypothetical protein Sradi_4757700 [Sesamum radiatum]|uniref:DUF4378 domain-containing protein n=1 Tax=Sesamum radiatum TaxID=300843 RepID=A0AAW2MX88_SESRA